MHDEIAHVRIINGLLGFRAPCRVGGRIVRIHADDIDLRQILELGPVEVRKFSTENKMEELFLRGLI